KKNPLRHWVKRVSSCKEFNPRHIWHPLVGDQEGDRLPPPRQCRQLSQPGRGPVGANDAGVVSEAPSEIPLERLKHGRLRGDEEDDRRSLCGHRLALSRRTNPKRRGLHVSYWQILNGRSGHDCSFL